MKYFFLTGLTVFLFNEMYSQNAIPNPGFESWATQGGYDEPGGWGTINQPVSQACFCKGTAVKSSAADAHSGSYAIKLVTLNIVLGIAPGITATGTINTTTRKVEGGVPFNWRPQDITGWYKYTPQGTDTASISIELSRWDTVAQQRVRVGNAVFTQSGAISSYTQFSVPFQYSLTGNPDTMVIIMLSSHQNIVASNANSTFFVDDLALTSVNGIGIPVESLLLPLYPNPASQFISFPVTPEKFTLKIFDGAGRVVRTEQGNGPVNYKVDISGLSQGIYFYEMTPSDSPSSYRGKFVVELSY